MFGWLSRLFTKSAPSASSSTSSTQGYDAPFAIDAYRRVRPPTPYELLLELKNTAYACATLNASTCAAHPPRLYVQTRKSDPAARCLTRSLPAHHPLVVSRSLRVEEVLEHPLLELFQQV